MIVSLWPYAVNALWNGIYSVPLVERNLFRLALDGWHELRLAIDKANPLGIRPPCRQWLVGRNRRVLARYRPLVGIWLVHAISVPRPRRCQIKALASAKEPCSMPPLFLRRFGRLMLVVEMAVAIDMAGANPANAERIGVPADRFDRVRPKDRRLSPLM